MVSEAVLVVDSLVCNGAVFLACINARVLETCSAAGPILRRTTHFPASGLDVVQGQQHSALLDDFILGQSVLKLCTGFLYANVICMKFSLYTRTQKTPIYNFATLRSSTSNSVVQSKNVSRNACRESDGRESEKDAGNVHSAGAAR